MTTDFLDIVRDRNQRGLRLITEREFVEEQKQGRKPVGK